MSSTGVPAATLDLIYDAALRPALWGDVVKDIAAKTGADQGAFILQNQISGQGGAILANIDPAAIDEYFGHFATRNPMQRHNLKYLEQYPQTPPPGVLTDLDIMPRSELMRTEYYNDFMCRFGMHATLMIGLALDEMDGSSIALTRPRSREDFSQAEMQLALAAQPHLMRALAIGRQLDTAHLVGGALAEVLEKSRRGIFLADAVGRIRYANRAGREIASGNDGLSDKDCLLQATGRAQARKLEALLGAAASPDREARTSGSLLLPRLSRRHPLTVIVMPVNTEMGAPYHNRPLALVCVSDPDQGAHIPTAQLCEIFDFTPAEAKVALELLAAEEPKAIAEHLHLSVNTVRVHMSSIFRKTNTSRQAELVRLLMQMSALDPG